jgi:hypothetical protein
MNFTNGHIENGYVNYNLNRNNFIVDRKNNPIKAEFISFILFNGNVLKERLEL